MSKKLIPITFSILFIVSCGGGGGGGSTPTTPTTPAPTVNLSAEPTSVLLESTSTLTWSSTNATSCSATWTSQTGTSGSEGVTITSPGNNSFSISCTGAGGTRSASVTVEGYRETDGVVVDGYISGAEVCIDEDESWTCDSNENSTTSDNEGKFTIRYANGNLVSIGGTDLDSQTLLDNLLITHKLTGHSDFKAVTPVTSIAAFMEDASLVNVALGIDASIDVFTFDPVENKGDGGINDYLYEKGNQLTVLAFALQNITNNLNTTTETTQDYFKAITEEIEKEYTETETKVDIETEAFVTKALENIIAAKSVTIDETAKSNTTKALAGVLPVIEVKPSNDLTTGVIRFAVSTLQTDIQAIASGTATAETVSSYTSDVLAYIAEDQNIDADEIAPDISAIADSASTSEDTALEISVLVNDSYLTSSPISVTAGNGTNGTTSISSNIVTYDPDTDYNGTDTFSYTITQGDKTSSADVTVTIEAVNDAPSIDIASTIQVEENQTAVATISVSDPDGDELTLTLGGTDVDSFNLSSDNVLTFKEAPDYETKTSYSISLTLTDGTEAVTKDLTIAISNVNDIAPEFTSEPTFTAAENQTAIGTVTATDADEDDVTFTITGDELAVTSAGVLTFISAPDFETKATYTATVTASDGTNSTTQDITVNIVDLFFLTNDQSSGNEDQNVTIDVLKNDDITSGTRVLDVSSTTNGSAEWSSTAAILNTYGHPVIIYTPDSNWNGLEEFSYQVSFDEVTKEANIQLTINPVNDAPFFGSLESGEVNSFSFTIDENQTSIGNIDAYDIEGDTITLELSGNDMDLFSISDSGVLAFINPPDAETKSFYDELRVSAKDGGNQFRTVDINVTVRNINDNSPTFTSPTSFTADENQTSIGTVTATDADGNIITYSISGSEITINSSTGVISFVSAPDYETKTSYSATVTASDGTNTTTQDITVNVRNLPNVSGIAYTSRYSVMDSDIPNTDYLAYSSNDTVSDAQAIINPSVVTGFIGGSDTLDVFSVSTSSSMYVNLDVVDYINDSKELRLYIYESDGSARDFSYTSASTEANMTILLPNGGDYLIAVRQENNSSKYILTLGQRYSSSSKEVSTDFIPNYVANEFVGYVPHNNKNLGTKINTSSNRIKEIELNRTELFDLTGYSFDDPGIKTFQIKKTDQLQLELSNPATSNNSGLQLISQKQADYLNDWSQLQYLRSIDGDTIFDLNYTYELLSFTRDPLYSLQWNLERVGLEPTLNALGQDVKDVAVAVIDSGGPTPNSTAWNASNLIDGGYDFVYGNSNSIDYLATSSNTGNNLSHGTHVSTTISAKNDGVDFNGYAVKALNINVFSVIGTGVNAKTGGASNANIANAILYASGLSNSSGSVAPNTTPIKVINLSLGGPSYSETLCAAVTDAISEGITVVAASGNAQDTNPGSISYPAACPGVISVGATNSAGEISSYSQQNTYVDISAPGGDYIDRDGNGIFDGILAYGNDSFDPGKALTAGTSMASPQVSAAIALMYAVDTSMTPSRVENMLIAGELTNDAGDSGKDNVYGYGVLNLPKAIENVLQDISSSTTYAYTSASYLDFSSTTTQLTIDLLKVGSGTLSVSSLSADNSSGLTYNDSSANSNGFGTYTIFIDRASIPNGEFSNTIYFNLSDGEKVAVRIYYNVGSLRSRANIGKAYIGMYDASDDSLWGSIEAVVNGSVSFIATDVAPGNYYILTSTDIDNDNTVCDYGELCEYYPKIGDTTYYFTVSDSDLTDYEIFLQPIVKYGGVNAASIENNSDQLNRINKTRKQKSFNQIRNIDLNLIGSNIEFKQNDVGIKGDKKFISN